MSTTEIDAVVLAAERPYRRRELAGHAFVFVAANALIVALWAGGDSSSFWPMWVLIGWGALLAADTWRTLAPSRRRGSWRGRHRPRRVTALGVQ